MSTRLAVSHKPRSRGPPMAHRFTIGVEEEFRLLIPARAASLAVMHASLRASPDIIERRCDPRDAPVVRRDGHEDLRKLTAAAHRDLCIGHEGTLVPSAGAAAAEEFGTRSLPRARILSPAGSTRSFLRASAKPAHRGKLQQLAPVLVDFGMHVHVAMPDKQTTIDMMNHGALLPAAPAGAIHQLAFLDGPQHRPESLSAHNRVSALSAHRRFPEQFESWSAYENFLSLLVKLNCIDSGKKIWWDVRPHPRLARWNFACAMWPPRSRSGGDCRRLPQAIVVKLHRLYTSNMTIAFTGAR